MVCWTRRTTHLVAVFRLHYTPSLILPSHAIRYTALHCCIVSYLRVRRIYHPAIRPHKIVVLADWLANWMNARRCATRYQQARQTFVWFHNIVFIQPSAACLYVNVCLCMLYACEHTNTGRIVQNICTECVCVLVVCYARLWVRLCVHQYIDLVVKTQHCNIQKRHDAQAPFWMQWCGWNCTALGSDKEIAQFNFRAQFIILPVNIGIQFDL